MTKKAVSRRSLLELGACALTGAALPAAASALPSLGPGKPNEGIIRKFYAGWEKKDWGPLDVLLADNFTFTSPNNDDHISKNTFKTRCWESQIDFIERFEIEKVIESGNEAFVKYLCRTKNGKAFRNTEYWRISDGRIAAIECYFGGQFGYPSAASTGQE